MKKKIPASKHRPKDQSKSISMGYSGINADKIEWSPRQLRLIEEMKKASNRSEQ